MAYFDYIAGLIESDAERLKKCWSLQRRVLVTKDERVSAGRQKVLEYLIFTNVGAL